MKVFNFRKKLNLEEEQKNTEQEEIKQEDIEQDTAQEKVEDESKKVYIDILESLEYTNSFLAQISLTLGELVKQETINNALYLLDQEYKYADSVMDVEEIVQKRSALLSSIFVDYQVKEKENEND